MKKSVAVSIAGAFSLITILLALSGFTSSNLTQQPPLQLDLLQNGNFEDSPVGLGVTTLQGWRVVKGNVDVIPDSSATFWAWHQPAGGTKSLELTGNPGAAAIEQSFSTQIGRKYVLTGWVSHHYAIREAGVDVSINGVAIEPLRHSTPNSQADMKWEKFTREFEATSATTTLRLEDSNLANWPWGGAVIDALSIVASPLPPGELLQNRSFEESPYGLGLTSLPGWAVSRGNIDIIPNNLALQQAWHQSADGLKSLELTGNPGVGAIKQTFPTLAGRTYSFTGWVSHHYAIREAGVNIYINGTPLEPLYHATSNSQADMKWERFTREFTAQSSITTLELADRNIQGWPWGGAVIDGLSVTLANNQNPLPPDPGEEGKKTLAGIDSDRDGVRDDVQIWIYNQYPNSEKRRAALRQVAVDSQEAILTFTDKEKSIEVSRKKLRSYDCFLYVFQAQTQEELVEVGNRLQRLKAKILNTRERSDAYVRADQNFSGQVFRLLPNGDLKNACRFDLERLQN